MKHEIYQAFKALASELHRKPTRTEFIQKLGMTRHGFEKKYGNFTSALLETGLMTPDETHRQASSKKPSPFTSDLKEVLKNHRSRKVITNYGGKKILVIGDVHFPFVNLNALSMIYAIIEIEKPDIIIQIGDLYDRYSDAKFPKSLNIYTPEQEHNLALEMAIAMWKKIRELVPNSECFQILGNHDVRPMKRIIEDAPQMEHHFYEVFKRYFQFDGVHFHGDVREPLVLENISFIHGYLSGLGKHRDKLRRSVVCGHSHLGGVSFANYGNETLFEGNAGFIGDEMSKAMGYMPTRITGWTLGCFEIDALGPRFISF